ncbi:MAG: hypothetical protein AB1651_09430 [Pseudomonadota bacterium]
MTVALTGIGEAGIALAEAVVGDLQHGFVSSRQNFASSSWARLELLGKEGSALAVIWQSEADRPPPLPSETVDLARANSVTHRLGLWRRSW